MIYSTHPYLSSFLNISVLCSVLKIMVARQESHDYTRPCVNCLAGQDVLSNSVGLTIVFTDPMVITETARQKNDCFGQ